MVRSVPLSRPASASEIRQDIEKDVGKFQEEIYRLKIWSNKKNMVTWLGNWEKSTFLSSWAWNIVQLTFLTVQDIAAPGSAPIHSYWSPFETGFNYYTVWLLLLGAVRTAGAMQTIIVKEGPWAGIKVLSCSPWVNNHGAISKAFWREMTSSKTLRCRLFHTIPHWHDRAGTKELDLAEKALLPWAEGYFCWLIPIIYWSYSFIFIQRLEYCTIHCR